MGTRTLRRDPYLRAELIREQSSRTGPCDWCGRTLTTAHGAPRKLWRYWWQSDQGGTPWQRDRHAFCSLDCWEAFNG